MRSGGTVKQQLELLSLNGSRGPHVDIPLKTADGDATDLTSAFFRAELRGC